MKKEPPESDHNFKKDSLERSVLADSTTNKTMTVVLEASGEVSIGVSVTFQE